MFFQYYFFCWKAISVTLGSTLILKEIAKQKSYLTFKQKPNIVFRYMDIIA
jgi:hypothetical protein